MTETGDCQSCRWWVPRPEYSAAPHIGYCHFAPPKVDNAMQHPLWPRTNADDFCGGWEIDKDRYGDAS